MYIYDYIPLYVYECLCMHDMHDMFIGSASMIIVFLRNCHPVEVGRSICGKLFLSD